MVTTIGIDSRKAPHTAVAIDQSETVLAEITVRADRFQIPRLLDWAYEVDGDGGLGVGGGSRRWARLPAQPAIGGSWRAGGGCADGTCLPGQSPRFLAGLTRTT